MKARRLRRTAAPVSLETRLASAGPAAWTTAAERARVATLLAAGGDAARAELLDLGVTCAPVVDLAVVVFDMPEQVFHGLRGRDLDRTVDDVVDSIVAFRRVVAVDEWVEAAGFRLSGRGWHIRAYDAIAARFDPVLASMWSFGPDVLRRGLR